MSVSDKKWMHEFFSDVTDAVSGDLDLPVSCCRLIVFCLALKWAEKQTAIVSLP